MSIIINDVIAGKESIPKNLQEQTIVLLGDSYEEYNGPTTSGVNTDFRADGYFTYANTLLNGAFHIVSNQGVGGETAEQIASRVGTALSYDTDFVLVGGGLNGAMSTSTVSTKFAALQSAYDAVINKNRILMVRTISPRAAAETAASIAAYHALNQRIRNYAIHNGAILLDMAAVCCNPDTGIPLASGVYGASENYFAADNAHLSTTGAAVFGTYIANILSSYIPAQNKLILTSGGTTSNTDCIYDATNGVNEAGNLISNGKMLGTTGTISDADCTGNLATGWTISNGIATLPTGAGEGAAAIVASKVAMDNNPYHGSWQQFSISGGDAGVSGSIASYKGSVLTAINGTQGINIGDQIWASVRFETDAANWGGANGSTRSLPWIYLNCVNSGFSTLASARILPHAANTDPLYRMASGVLKTPRITIPATTAYIFLYISFSGKGVVRFSDAQIRKVI